jgi:hypothetical protein
MKKQNSPTDEEEFRILRLGEIESVFNKRLKRIFLEYAFQRWIKGVHYYKRYDTNNYLSLDFLISKYTRDSDIEITLESGKQQVPLIAPDYGIIRRIGLQYDGKVMRCDDGKNMGIKLDDEGKRRLLERDYGAVVYLYFKGNPLCWDGYMPDISYAVKDERVRDLAEMIEHDIMRDARKRGVLLED